MIPQVKDTVSGAQANGDLCRSLVQGRSTNICKQQKRRIVTEFKVLLRPVENEAKSKSCMKATCAKTTMLGLSNRLRTATNAEPSKTFRAQIAFAGVMQMKMEHPDRKP